MAGRLVRYGLVAAGLLVAAVVAVAAYRADQKAVAPAIGTPPATGACSPPPCADLQGYALWISNVKVEGQIVSMQIVFRNASESTHADPSDLQLVDSQQHTSSPIFDTPACTRWSRTEFQNGAKFGPLTVCFRPATVAAPLILRWSPDMGFLCCRTDIRLP